MIVTKDFDGGFFLKVHLTQNLELAYVCNRVGPDVLRMKIEKVQDISEELRPGRAEAAMKVVSDDNNFSVLRPGFFL